MNYYRMLDDIHYPNRWQLDAPESNDVEVDPSDFTTGRPFMHNTKLICKRDPGVSLDYTLAELDVPIASARLCRVISRCSGEDVQMIPVLIEGIDEKYYIINAIRSISCLDEGRSVFTKWGLNDGRPDKIGSYRMVAKLRVELSSIQGANVFRIHGWDVPLIVSDIIKKEIEKHNFKGIIFESVS